MPKTYTLSEKIEAQLKRYPERNHSILAEKYNISLREVKQIVKQNEVEKKEIVRMFRTSYDNRTSTISKSLNIKEHKVSRIINTYLNQLK